MLRGPQADKQLQQNYSGQIPINRLRGHLGIERVEDKNVLEITFHSEKKKKKKEEKKPLETADSVA